MKSTLSFTQLGWGAVFRDWILGPYQVRQSPILSMSQDLPSVQAQLRVRAGVECVALEVPFYTRVSRRQGPFRTVLWDGTRLMLPAGSSSTMQLWVEIPAGSLFLDIQGIGAQAVRVAYSGAVLTERGSLRRAWHHIAQQWKNGSFAVAIHALIFALTWNGWYGSGSDAILDTTPLEMAAAPEEAPTPAATSAATSSSLEDAFAGSMDRAFQPRAAHAPTPVPARVAQQNSGWKGFFQGLRSAQAGSAPQMQVSAAPRAEAAISPQDLAILHALFQKNQERARACYERALLVDETLSVVAQLEANLVAAGAGARIAPGHYQFQGEGSSQAREQLTRCLDQILGSESLPARFRGASVRYSFMFKS